MNKVTVSMSSQYLEGDEISIGNTRMMISRIEGNTLTVKKSRWMTRLWFNTLRWTRHKWIRFSNLFRREE